MDPAFPVWLEEMEQAARDQTFKDDREKMMLAVRTSAESIRHQGGPFGAAIFDRATHQLVALGANCVVPCNCSHWHAEMVAIYRAEAASGRFNLRTCGEQGYELFSSCEPCVMCIGGTLWAGVTRLIFGALDEDARTIGFDEGPKPPEWQAYLRARQVEVVGGLCREEARAVLQRYSDDSGLIYNAT